MFCQAGGAPHHYGGEPAPHTEAKGKKKEEKKKQKEKKRHEPDAEEAKKK